MNAFCNVSRETFAQINNSSFVPRGTHVSISEFRVIEAVWITMWASCE